MSHNLHKERIEEYVDRVCSRIRAPKWRKQDIALELKSHLADLVEEELGHCEEKYGCSPGQSQEEAAWQRALAHMGDPDDLGIKLHRVHKLPFDWMLMASVACLAALGIFMMWAAGQSDSKFGEVLFAYKWRITAVSGIVMLGLCFTDYRKWVRFGYYLYGATVLMLIYIYEFGEVKAGYLRYVDIFNRQIDLIEFIPFLLAISFAGIFGGSRPKPVPWMKLLALLAAPVLLLYITGRPITMIKYGVLCFTILMVMRMKWAAVGSLLVVSTSVFIQDVLLRDAFFIKKVIRYSFLQPMKDPRGEGYQYIQAQKTLQHAGWFGKGVAPDGSLRLPALHSDMVFVYLTYTLGWLAASLLVLLIVVFIFKGFQLSVKVQDLSGKLVSAGIISLLGFDFAWHILMSLGLVPIVGISLPFISYGGFSTLLPFASAGLLLSVHRHRQNLGNPIIYVGSNDVD